MKRQKPASVIAGVLWVVLLAGRQVWAQGSLTPPGAPAPTMKTLAQIEPRTPISSAGYTITQSGSYYLTTNLTCTGHGVVIQASDVTVDLNGFCLSGDKGPSDDGVRLDGATNAAIVRVTVRNGVIRNFSYGLWVGFASDSVFEHLALSSNLYDGVYLKGSSGRCRGNVVQNCMVSDNGDAPSATTACTVSISMIPTATVWRRITSPTRPEPRVTASGTCLAQPTLFCATRAWGRRTISRSFPAIPMVRSSRIQARSRTRETPRIPGRIFRAELYVPDRPRQREGYPLRPGDNEMGDADRGHAFHDVAGQRDGEPAPAQRRTR